MRSQLVAALALQGVLLGAELAWPHPADWDGAESYLATVALALDDQGERIARGEDALRRASGSAIAVRLELGCRLGVLD
jgi:hypothetical protein